MLKNLSLYVMNVVNTPLSLITIIVNRSKYKENSYDFSPKYISATALYDKKPCSG